MPRQSFWSFLLSVGAFTLSLEATNYTVTSNSDDPTVAGSLSNIITQINIAAFTSPSTPQSFAITFSPAVSNITLVSNPITPIVTSPSATMTGSIDGGGVTINGSGTQSGFILIGNGSAGSGAFSISNMTIKNAAAIGGTGGSGFTAGGGGGGLGGAVLLLNGANAEVQSVAFSNNTAQGGNGGDASDTVTFIGAAGGGGIHGKGGSAHLFCEAGGGGLIGNVGNLINGGGSAGGGLVGNGGDSTNGSGSGGGGLIPPNINGQPDQSGSLGGDGGGPNGGIGGNNSFGTAGGLASGGGGGGGPGTLAVGGDGGYGGGGGAGSRDAMGGNGGFGGGGGGSGASDGILGGNGGFGGGGGAGFGGTGVAQGGNGGFGGGGGSSSGASGSVTSGAGGFGAGSGGAVATGGGTATAGTPGFGAGSGGASVDPAGTAGGGGGASLGGATFIQNGSSLTVINCTFSGNNVTLSSGGAAATGGSPGAPGTAALGADFFLMSGGTLNFNLSSNLHLTNPIESNQGAGGGDTTAGGLNKSGSGLLELSGINTYTGTTTVQSGELRIDTSVATDISVQTGGTLSGNFSILQNTPHTNGGNLTNAGIVIPGVPSDPLNGLGQINISGDFINNEGTLAIGITPSGTNGSLNLTGAGSSSSLNGGTLSVYINPGIYLNNTEYLVINNPVTGTFANVVQTGPLAGTLVIDVLYSSVVLVVHANPIFIPTNLKSKVAREVAKCITNALPLSTGDFATVIQNIGRLSNSQINQALIDLSPVNYGALDWINERNNNYLADILAEHLFQLSCSPRDCYNNYDDNAVWVDVFGNLMNNHKHFNNLSPFVANAIGVVAGLDHCFTRDFKLGGAFAYTHTHLDWKQNHGNGNINSYYGALYGSYEELVNLDFSVIGGGSNYSLKRKIDIRGSNVVMGTPVVINRSAKSTPTGYFLTGHLGLGKDWTWSNTTLEPFGLVDYNYFHLNSFKEHDANSLNLHVQKHNQNMLRGEAGLKVYRTWFFENSCLAPYFSLSWVGEFPLGTSKEKASFAGQSCVIDVTSYHSSMQLVSPQVGLKWTMDSGFTFSVGYKGLYNSKTSINEAEGRLEWVF